MLSPSSKPEPKCTIAWSKFDLEITKTLKAFIADNPQYITNLEQNHFELKLSVSNQGISLRDFLKSSEHFFEFIGDLNKVFLENDFLSRFSDEKENFVVLFDGPKNSITFTPFEFIITDTKAVPLDFYNDQDLAIVQKRIGMSPKDLFLAGLETENRIVASLSLTALTSVNLNYRPSLDAYEPDRILTILGLLIVDALEQKDSSTKIKYQPLFDFNPLDPQIPDDTLLKKRMVLIRDIDTAAEPKVDSLTLSVA